MGVMEKMLQRTLAGIKGEDIPANLLSRKVHELPIAAIESRKQARLYFDPHELEKLGASIRAHGVLEPILVRPKGGGKYEIIAGERRYRASLQVGLESIPAVILEVDERAAQVISLLENLQRENLNPYEETLGILGVLVYTLGLESTEQAVSLLYRMHNERKGRVPQSTPQEVWEGVEEVFRELGRMSWESFVRTRLPLLHLPEDIQVALMSGELSYTAALELKKVRDPSLRWMLLREAKGGLSLSELRSRVRSLLKEEKESASPPPLEAVLKRLRSLRTSWEALGEEKRKEAEALLARLLDLLEPPR